MDPASQIWTVAFDDMETKKLSNLAKFAFLATGIVLLGLVLFMSIMPAGPVHVVENFFELNRIRAELKAAEERWQAQHISNYEIDVTGFAPACIYGEISPLVTTTLVVRNDILVQAYVLEHGMREGISFAGVTCPLKTLTVLEGFKTLKQSLEYTSIWSDYLRVQFDSESGFITDRESGTYKPVSSCCSYFHFRNLRPIEEK